MVNYSVLCVNLCVLCGKKLCTEDRIKEIVYELFGLKEEEIKIVEE